jgi:hypothetical protein
MQRSITRRVLSAADIQRRALLAMVNEAALLLAAGVASRASDIDVVLAQGYGFPRWEGGPVFWARQQDRSVLAKTCKPWRPNRVMGLWWQPDLSSLINLISESKNDHDTTRFHLRCHTHTFWPLRRCIELGTRGRFGRYSYQKFDGTQPAVWIGRC